MLFTYFWVSNNTALPAFLLKTLYRLAGEDDISRSSSFLILKQEKYSDLVIHNPNYRPPGLVHEEGTGITVDVSSEERSSFS